MPTERVQVVFTERGSRRVSRNIREIGTSASSSATPVKLLQRALAFVGGTLLIRQLVDLSDTYTSLQNRIRVVTADTRELVAVTEQLFDIANRTRSNYQATVEVYARASLSLRALGVSQQEVIAFTESLNQAVLISGANVREANAALIQLSQGLASGALRGDELRSVMEQLPVVADVISKSLGVTRGQLRTMGEQGKITSEVIVTAFEEAREELVEKFAKILPTIGQSFVVLRNNVVQLVGDLNQATGASVAISSAILTLSMHVDTLARALGALTILIGVGLVRRAIPLAISGLTALGSAIVAHPIGALLVAITAVVSTLIAFRHQIQLSAEGAATLGDLASAVFERVADVAKGLVTTFRPAFDTIHAFVERFTGDFDISLGSIILITALVVDRFVGFWEGAFRTIVEIHKQLPAVILRITETAVNALLTQVSNNLNVFIRGFNLTFSRFGVDAIQELQLNISTGVPEFEEIGGALGAAFTKGFRRETSTNLARELLERAEELAQARNELAGGRLTEPGPRNVPINPNFTKYLLNLEQEGVLLQLNSEMRLVQEALFKSEDILKRRLTATEVELVTNLVKSNAEYARQADLIEAIQGPFETYTSGLRTLDSLLARGTVTTGEFRIAQRDLWIEFLSSQSDAEAGITRFFLEVEKLNENVANAVQEVLRDAHEPLLVYERGLRALQEVYKRGKIEADEFREAHRDLRIEFLNTQTTLEAGFERFFLKAQRGAEDAATTIETLLTDSFQSAEDALVDFVTTGKADFRSLVQSIAADLVRLAIRKTLLSGLESALGSVLGFGTGAAKAAGGGFVAGAGTGTSDSIPVRVSRGEYIVNAAATSNNLSLLQRINRGGQASGGNTIQINLGPTNVDVRGGMPEGGFNEQQLEEAGSQMQRRMQDVVVGVIVREQMPGGKLFGGRA